MKKLLVFLFFCVFLVPNIDAQIMHYTSKVVYDQNGVQYSTKDKYPGLVSTYFAIVNGNMIYRCDKNGNKASFDRSIMRYIGEKNGVYVFQDVNNEPFYRTLSPYLYLSKDWKRINLIYREPNFGGNLVETTIVYEQSDPNDIGAPSQFY